jgi:hypothetical protein
MSSMLDEPKAPAAPIYDVCPCCKLRHKTIELYEDHLFAMKSLIEMAISKSQSRARKLK